MRHGEWSGDEFSQTFPHGKAAAVGNDAETSSDPHLLNVVCDMRSWLLLESVFCSCGDHPDSKDPYCLWCENDVED